MVLTGSKADKYFPVYLDSLRVDTAPDFDLYLRNDREILLYRAAHLPFTEHNRQVLLENGVTRLYVKGDDRSQYRHYLEDNLASIVTDSSIKSSVRAGIVYDSAKMLVENLFHSHDLRGDIGRSRELVQSTVGFILTEGQAFHQLLSVMAVDYNTYSHSVNVCTLSLALARFVGINDPQELKALGTGALLHDLGKGKIPDKILNKTSSLTPSEMELIRNHPQWGYEMVTDAAELNPESYQPILQHHERENSSGYPASAAGNDIHLYGKITAIADVFDAMTTNRIYRPAVSSYDSLKVMFADEGAFDRRLLESFTLMLAPRNWQTRRPSRSPVAG